VLQIHVSFSPSFLCSFSISDILCLPAKDRDRPDAREFGDWSRKGPLPDLPGRGGSERRVSDRGFGSGRTFGDSGSDAGGGERRERRDPFPQDDGKVRDFGNWERRGPLSPLPQQERQTSSREGGRPTTNDGPRAEGFRDRRSSPAAWGEGRTQGSQDGSRPPRREFQERPAVERVPTAAEQDSQWRTKMKPDAPTAHSQAPSRDGSEAPSSPAVAAAPASRPKLNLAKRTVSEAPDLPSPASNSGDAKASPFGGARPIDTAAKEKEIEEKRLVAIREKKEADDKAREEKRIAKEAAKAEKSSGSDAGKDNGESAPSEILQRDNGEDTKEATTIGEGQNGNIVDDKAVKPREVSRDTKPKPAESGTWRRPSGGPKPPRNDAPRGPRGDGAPRGPRNDGPRAPRTNGGAQAAATGSTPATPVDSETTNLEDDGWSTVSKPKKNQRTGNQPTRAIAS
jgi:translation initiation factor 4B